MEQNVTTPRVGLAHIVVVARQAVHPIFDHPVFERPARGLRRFRQWRKAHLAWLARPLAFLGFLGPGLIAANAGNDAGAVATWSQVGALFGFQFLWVLIIITVALAVVQEMCARMGAATGKGLSDLIRERFGVRGAAFAMLTLFIANALVTISEFAGIAAASELLGIPKYITIPIAAAGVWLLITRGSYGKVERIFLIMSLAFLTYPIAAVLARPDWGSVLHSTVVPSFHPTVTYLQLLVGTIGTTITPYMQLFIQSSVAEKGVDMEHYGHERLETYLGSVFAAVIVASIVIAVGATIFAASQGAGAQITSAEQAAVALEPFLGRYAPILFAVGLLGASLLAAAVLPLSTSYSICESFGWERGVSRSFKEAPIFNGLFTGLLGFGALVALIPGLPLIQLIVVSQIINGVLLPILLVFILKLVNDRRIMGKYVNSPGQNVIAKSTVAVLAALSAIMLASTILPAVGVPFLQ